MSQNTSPDNVPSAKHGTADSLAAPGRVGAGGAHLHPAGCTCADCVELQRRWASVGPDGFKLRAFAQRYAVELLFVQLVAVLLNVAALGLSVTKLLGVCA